MDKHLDVIVIGGGYAGVMTANRLTERADVAVTLINPRPTFVERIRLHQLVAGSDDAVVDYREVLADRVRLVVDAAVRIDVAERRVALASGATVDYDYLVYAVGSHSADAAPSGAAEHAYPIASLEEAQRLRPVLGATPLTAPVTIVGAGPTGIETPTMVAVTFGASFGAAEVATGTGAVVATFSATLAGAGTLCRAVAVGSDFTSGVAHMSS